MEAGRTKHGGGGLMALPPFFFPSPTSAKNGEKEAGEFVKLRDVSIRVHAFFSCFFAREKLHLKYSTSLAKFGGKVQFPGADLP